MLQNTIPQQSDTIPGGSNSPGHLTGFLTHNYITISTIIIIIKVMFQ
jgi:hypothetical protein